MLMAQAQGRGKRSSALGLRAPWLAVVAAALAPAPVRGQTGESVRGRACCAASLGLRDPLLASGPQCQYTRNATCSNLGKPLQNGDCACDLGHKCLQTPNKRCAHECTSHATVSIPDDGVCECEVAWAGQRCECFQGVVNPGPCLSCSTDDTGPAHTLSDGACGFSAIVTMITDQEAEARALAEKTRELQLGAQQLMNDGAQLMKTTAAPPPPPTDGVDSDCNCGTWGNGAFCSCDRQRV